LGWTFSASTVLVIRHKSGHGDGRTKGTQLNLLQMAANRWAGDESLGWRQMLTGELRCLSTLLGEDVQYQKARREKNSNGIVKMN
jgi:hypothetical protein